MQDIILNTPAMYADHHVLAVRRILLEMPGISEIDASSAFHVVQVKFDETRITADAIRARLDEFGYLDNLTAPSESGSVAGREEGIPAIFRHSLAYEHMPKEVSFGQSTPYQGRPLWHCPGIGVIKGMDN